MVCLQAATPGLGLQQARRHTWTWDVAGPQGFIVIKPPELHTCSRTCAMPQSHVRGQHSRTRMYTYIIGCHIHYTTHQRKRSWIDIILPFIFKFQITFTSGPMFASQKHTLVSYFLAYLNLSQDSDLHYIVQWAIAIKCLQVINSQGTCKWWISSISWSE